MAVNPDNSIFVVLSFEGPDVYSMAGGLGARMSHLTSALAEMGYEVHFFFIGDPRKEGVEVSKDGKLILHRWSQWISGYHPGGVYDGEAGKVNDFTDSVPPFVIREIVVPALRDGKQVVILGEEWHTAQTVCSIGDLLREVRVQDRVVMFWNANNTYGFERIDWSRLAGSATISTVSKYMKQIMRKMGLHPLVIPNGIEKALLKKVDPKTVSTIKRAVNADLLLSKVARWHPDKGWEPAIQVMDVLKKAGKSAVLLARGSVEAYGHAIAAKARSLGLTMTDITLEGDHHEHYRRAVSDGDFRAYLEAISRTSAGDILNLAFPVPHAFLQAIYKASDLVLANSAHEPFGLVGLEAMATGSVVFTGCSGEDYAVHMNNAIVLDTFDPGEIAFYIHFLQLHPDKRKSIARAARKTAEKCIWEEVIKELLCKIEYDGNSQGKPIPKKESAPVDQHAMW